MLKNLCSLAGFKPPADRIRCQLQVLDGAPPIPTLFEVTRSNMIGRIRISMTPLIDRRHFLGLAAAPLLRGMPVPKIKNVSVIATAPVGLRLVVVKIETDQDGLYGYGCATFTRERTWWWRQWSAT